MIDSRLLMVERKRHLAKAITYRLLGSTVTAGIGYLVSGSFELGAALGVADTVLKTGLYYAHERIWYRIKWGVVEGVPDRFESRVHMRPVEVARVQMAPVEVARVEVARVEVAPRGADEAGVGAEEKAEAEAV